MRTTAPISIARACLLITFILPHLKRPHSTRPSPSRRLICAVGRIGCRNGAVVEPCESKARILTWTSNPAARTVHACHECTVAKMPRPARSPAGVMGVACSEKTDIWIWFVNIPRVIVARENLQRKILYQITYPACPTAIWLIIGPARNGDAGRGWGLPRLQPEGFRASRFEQNRSPSRGKSSGGLESCICCHSRKLCNASWLAESKRAPLAHKSASPSLSRVPTTVIVGKFTVSAQAKRPI